MKNFVIATFLLAACTHVPAALGQNDAKQNTKVAVNDDTRCKREVTQYVEALQFVRQSAGEQVSANFMKNYVPQAQIDQLISGSGYCAAAQVIRDKRAPR